MSKADVWYREFPIDPLLRSRESFASDKMPTSSDSSLPGANEALLSPEIAYLVGVSGGRDSVVLLHWLVKLGFENLVICHFNHALRGRDSDGDEAFVRALAAELQFEFVSVKNDSSIFARQSKQSIETAARESRYRFFARTARERKCQRLLLAHHADDQAETVLMNLFRGTGLKGLGGMDAVSHREIDGMPLEVIRPFLAVTRAQIEAYREEHQLAHREDATNGEPVAVRNRVRNELLPLAKDIFQRDVSDSILRVSEIAAMEFSAAQHRAGKWLKENRQPGGEIPVREMRQLAPADLHHILHLWLKLENIPNYGLDEVRSLTELVKSDGKPAKINLPADHHARRRAGWLFVEKPH